MAASVAARSRATPPSAHSMRQSPGAMRRFGQHHQAALEAARLRDLLELDLGGVVDVGADTHDHVRRLHQMAEGFGGERGNLGEGLARDQLGRELAADRDRHFDRFGFQPRLDAGERLVSSRSRPSAITGAAALRAAPARGRRQSPCDRPATRRRRAGARPRPREMVGFSPVAKSSSNRYLAVAFMSSSLCVRL